MYARAFLIAVLIAVAVVVPAAASAARTSSDTLTGYEYYATATDGKFAGTASGAFLGGWNADVRHTALCLSCATTSTITGGSFLLVTLRTGAPTLITGSFAGGTVQVTDKGANCTNQTFAVAGILGKVGTWYSGSGTGSFNVTLTHYRQSIFGNCVTYGASVAGSVTLAF
jgi:hypothetical protein